MAISWWGKFMAHLHASLDTTCKSGISKISPRCQNLEGRSQSSFIMSRLNQNWKLLGDILVSHIGGVNHLSTFDLELRNASFELISFKGFPAILCALQIFQICIFMRKYSKLTFSNGYQLMGKKFMAHLHASLDTTCKSRITRISTRCQNQEGKVNHLSTCPGWIWTEKF